MNKVENLAKNVQRETGGAIIGYKHIDPITEQYVLLIHFISDEGTNIDVSSTHFNGDMKYFIELDQQYRDEIDAQLIGIWHSHPKGIPTLSGGDLMSLQRIFTLNPDLYIFLAPLFAYHENERVLDFYYMKNGENNFVQIPKDNIKISPESEIQVKIKDFLNSEEAEDLDLTEKPIIEGEDKHEE